MAAETQFESLKRTADFLRDSSFLGENERAAVSHGLGISGNDLTDQELRVMFGTWRYEMCLSIVEQLMAKKKAYDDMLIELRTQRDAVVNLVDRVMDNNLHPAVVDIRQRNVLVLQKVEGANNDWEQHLRDEPSASPPVELKQDDDDQAETDIDSDDMLDIDVNDPDGSFKILMREISDLKNLLGEMDSASNDESYTSVHGTSFTSQPKEDVIVTPRASATFVNAASRRRWAVINNLHDSFDALASSSETLSKCLTSDDDALVKLDYDAKHTALSVVNLYSKLLRDGMNRVMKFASKKANATGGIPADVVMKDAFSMVNGLVTVSNCVKYVITRLFNSIIQHLNNRTLCVIILRGKCACNMR